MEQEQYDEALSAVSSEVLAFAGDEQMTVGDRARAELLSARATFFGQRALGVRDSRNDERVVRGFERAERLGAELTASDLTALAETLAQLGQSARAIRRADALPSSELGRRARVYRAVVELELGQVKPDFERASELLAALVREPGLSVDDRVWAIESQTRVRLAQGFVREAADRLVQDLVRLEALDAGRTALLHVLLGESYAELGEVGKATAQFERAVSLADEGEGVHARARLGLAALEADPNAALGLCDAVAAAHSGTDWRLPALLGRAEAQTALQRVEDAAETYRELVSAFALTDAPATVTRERIAESAIGRGRSLLDAGDASGALSVLSAVEPLFAFEEFPDDGVRALGEAYRALAVALLPEDASPGRLVAVVERLDAATRAEARSKLLAAGQYFTEHARRVVLSDPEAYADSLWHAADAFDLGGSPTLAVAALGEFASGFPDDPRRPEAVFRLARTLHATGDVEQAVELYRELRAVQADSSSASAGIWADAALTPLAQALLDDSDAENDEEALALLARVVEGEVGGPNSAVFRDALHELGRLLYERGPQAEAIARLRETIERFADDERSPTVRYRLADAHRKLADQIALELSSAGLPTGEAEGLRQRRAAALTEALGLFEQARDALEGIDSSRATGAEGVLLRNSRFALGDVAFDLGDYGAAVRFYDEARERHANDPAALVALVQIVNAHVAQGDMERARAANERARRLFQELPADVWDDPLLPMTREDWERWLDSTSRLYAAGNG